MRVVNPYLNFNGTTEEAFNFYKSIFGGEFAMLMRYNEMPTGPGSEGCEDMEGGIPEAEQNGIMHIALPIGSSMLMGTDVPSIMPPVITGTNTILSLGAESREEADRVFNALAEGGVVQQPLQDMFWGDYYGMLTDKYGIQWMMNFNEKYL